jgi:bacterioferritin
MFGELWLRNQCAWAQRRLPWLITSCFDKQPAGKEDGMDTSRVIEALNKAVALENAALLQYKQHALLVRGLWRRVFSDFFSAESHSALDHARKFGQKIVALGGVPTVEVGATVRQSLNVEEMLRQDLDLERQAMQVYLAAHRLAEHDVALRNMLEDQIEQEQRDIEELELYLNMVQTGAVAPEVNLRVV